MLFSDGKMTRNGELIFTTIGIASSSGLIFFLDDLSDYRAWILIILATVFGGGAAWAGLMQKWGFKPFTSDPLGWRKSKKTYEND